MSHVLCAQTSFLQLMSCTIQVTIASQGLLLLLLLCHPHECMHVATSNFPYKLSACMLQPLYTPLWDY